jgi:hypothetical protein
MARLKEASVGLSMVCAMCHAAIGTGAPFSRRHTRSRLLWQPDTEVLAAKASVGTRSAVEIAVGARDPE